MWKMNYRITVHQAGADEGVGAVLLEINADYGEEIGLNAAIGKALQGTRMFQSIGTDAEAVVVGKPTGADAAGTARVLTAGEKAEKLYAKIDAPGKGLLQAINIASKAAPGVSALDGDVAPDLGAIPVP